MTKILFGILWLTVPVFNQAADSLFAHLSSGREAPDFKLRSLAGEEFSLKKLNAKASVVLIFLRGWPGYQCPVCTRQLADLMSHEEPLKQAGAQVILIFPGPSQYLEDHAKEFASGQVFPRHFHFATDPDFTVVNRYGLRWEAEEETVYPASLVIGKKGTIVFSKFSRKHGGRSTAEEILTALEKAR